MSPADIPLPVLRAHRFDLRRPLDMDQVATLAVVANPDLRAARARLGVARAQAFAAILTLVPLALAIGEGSAI